MSIKHKTTLEEQRVFCYVCGEEFEYKEGFASEHMKKYPLHIYYRSIPK
jgi:hypothetical protein